MMQDNKTRILSEAEALFKKRGVRDVSIDDICRQVGISKRTFYQYYGQKEDLIVDVISLGMEKIQKGMDEFFDAHDAVGALLCISELATKKVMFIQKNKMAEDIKKYYPGTFEKATKSRSKITKDSLSAFIAKGVEEGYFRNDIDQHATLKLMMLTHFGMVEYYSDDFVTSGKKISRKAMSNAFIDMIRHVLLSPKGWEEFHRRKVALGDVPADQSEVQDK